MVESRIVKVRKNLITSVLQNVLNLTLTYVSRLIFVKVLDAGYLGINGLFSNVLNILSLADLGMGTVMMYSLYKPIAESDTKKIGALISFFRKIYLTIALSILGVGLAVIPFLKYIINLEKAIPHLEWYYVLALLNVVISYLFIYRTTLIAADQKSYILNKYVMAFKVITFVVQIAVLLMFKNYFIYLLAALVISFMSNLCQNAVAMKMYPYLKEPSSALRQEEKKKISENVKATFLYKICSTIQSNTDNVLVSIFVGTIFVGYYSNYIMIVTAVVTIVTLIFTSVKAGVGNLIASGDASENQKLFLFRVLELINFWLISFCAVCFICLFQDFIEISFGSGYLLSFSVVVMIVLNFYTSNIRQTIWTFRETTGLFHETRYITAVTAIVNIFLSLLLGCFWGMFGIIVATIIARMVYAWWKEPMILFHKYFHENPKIYYVTYIKRVCLCIIVSAATYGICNLIDIENVYVAFAMKILVCCVVPNGLFLGCYFRTQEFKYIYERTIKMFIKRCRMY
ncbi:MAG: hypothetical protein HDR28_03915 [Lachnospiraceae bacterium]|nr:hypothetical protein [Lachnospiraceae bacterium]